MKEESVKKLINPNTNREDYFLNWKEAAEHIDMSVGTLKHRHTDKCSLHPDLIPKKSIHNNKFGFWLSDMDHYKNKYSKKSPTKKPKVAETSETAEIIELSKTKVKRD